MDKVEFKTNQQDFIIANFCNTVFQFFLLKRRNWLDLLTRF